MKLKKEDAKTIIDLMVDKEDYELVINKQRDCPLDDYTMIFYYAWSTKNDDKNEWEHTFQDMYSNNYAGEEIIRKLRECDKYMILDSTKTVFVWQI